MGSDSSGLVGQMLASIKRLFGKQGIERDLSAIAEWAQRRGFGFKRVRGEDGFVIDGLLEGKTWRLEWAPRSVTTSSTTNFGCAWSSRCRPTCKCFCCRAR